MCSRNCGPPLTTALPSDHPTEVFLDTTVLLAPFKGGLLGCRAEETIAPFGFKGTSTYALLEFGRVLLKEVKYFVNQLRSGATLQELSYHVNNRLPRQFHSKRIMWFFNLIMQNFGHPEAEERTRLRLEEMLINGTDAVRRKYDHVADGIGCHWADQKGDWTPPKKCSRKSVHCGIVNFFQDNKDGFLAIRDACRAASTDPTGQLGRSADLIDRAAVTPSYLRDEKVCRQLGDALIAVQSRKYRAFFTQNFNDSRVLCPVMRQLLIELPQRLQDPVGYRDFRGNRDAQRS